MTKTLKLGLYEKQVLSEEDSEDHKRYKIVSQQIHMINLWKTIKGLLIQSQVIRDF